MSRRGNGRELRSSVNGAGGGCPVGELCASRRRRGRSRARVPERGARTRLACEVRDSMPFGKVAARPKKMNTYF